MCEVDDYYQRNAKEYFTQTLNVDMASLYSRFLTHIPDNGKILDAGCGSGRDAKAFLGSGYDVTAVDASSALAKLATEHLDQLVDVMRFQNMAYEKEFDGIWACASLLHVSQNDLPDVFHRLTCALKPKGVLYVSFKYGQGETENDGRHFTHMDESHFKSLLEKISMLEEIENWSSDDCRPDRDKERWFNALLRAKEEH